MYECIFTNDDTTKDKKKYFDYPKCKLWSDEEKEKIEKRIEKYEKLVEANKGSFLERQSAKIGLKKANKAKEAFDNIYSSGMCGK
jgi:hypothetical protein